MARPSKYNEKYHIPWIKGLARRGCTIEEIAQEVGVAQSTIHKWMAENEDLSEAVKSGRAVADIEVETSLYKRATGYKITKKKTIVSAGDDQQRPVRIEINEEDVAPDTTACIFWLKNRRPDIWRDRTETELKGKIQTESDANVSLANIPDELLEKVVRSINGEGE